MSVKEGFLLKSFVDHYEVHRPIAWSQQFNSSGPLDLEIGCGNGELLVRMAKGAPQRNFIGIEQNWERVSKTLKRVSQEGLLNVRVLMVEARMALERLFALKSIENIYAIFPCPWPKKSHTKHRLFSHTFLRLMNSRLVAQGHLKIVTDHQPFVGWIMEQTDQTGFVAETRIIQPQYDTKYERKWLAQGQREFFELDFYKQKHIDVPLKEDVALKTYAVKDFNPGTFFLAEQRGSITVVQKDFLFDEKRKIAMLRLVVAEESLTQHLWVTIVWDKGSWLIVPAQGNKFIPSEGIAQALKLVYEACQHSLIKKKL